MKKFLALSMFAVTAMLFGPIMAFGALLVPATGGLLMSLPAQQARAIFTETVVSLFKERVRPTQFLGSFFRKTYSDTKMVSIEVQRGRELVAVDVIRGTKGNLNTATRSTLKQFIPPMYWEYFNANELDSYDVMMGNLNASSVMRTAEQAAAKLIEITDKIDRAYEVQRAQVLKTGILELKSGDNIDFKRKAGSKVNVSAGSGEYWTHTNGVPYTDLENGCKFLRETGKMQGATVNAIMGASALTAFLSNTQVKTRADIRSFALDRIFLQDMPEGMSFHGEVSAGSYNVRIWTYPQSYETIVGGNIVNNPYIDDNLVVLIPSTPNFVMAYGAVPMVMDNDTIRSQSGEFLVQEFMDYNAANHVINTKSAAIAVPVAVDQIYTMQVTV
jgi:hypothetical protein